MCDYKKECAAYEAESCDKVNPPTVFCFEPPLIAQKEPVDEVPCCDGLCKLPAEAIAVEDDWQLAQDHIEDKNWKEAYDAMRRLQDKISELNGMLLAKIIA